MTTLQRASNWPASSAATVREMRRSGCATARAVWRTQAQATSSAIIAMPMPAISERVRSRA